METTGSAPPDTFVIATPFIYFAVPFNWPLAVTVAAIGVAIVVVSR